MLYFNMVKKFQFNFIFIKKFQLSFNKSFEFINNKIVMYNTRICWLVHCLSTRPNYIVLSVHKKPEIMRAQLHKHLDSKQTHASSNLVLF